MARRLAAVALVAFVAATAGAQNDRFEGVPIAALRFEGLRALSEDTIAYYLGLEVGKPFSAAEVDAKLHELWDRGLVDHVEVGADRDEGGGLVVTVTVEERPVLRSVEYEGLKKVSRTDLADRIRAEGIRLREGEPLRRGELVRLRDLILTMYREQGYRFTEVRQKLVPVTTGEVQALFTIDEGDKVKVHDIAFTGNSVFGGRRLRWTMKKTKESGLFTRILKKDVYNPASLQEDVQSIVDRYREKGYKNARVGEPQIEVRALRPRAATVNKQKRRLFITLPIEEGERFRFGEVRFEGNEVYKDEVLSRLFTLQQGKWLKASALEKGSEAISDLYRNTGYIYSHVGVDLEEREGNVADVILRIDEGDQYRVGRLEFAGNERTLDRVLRREFRVQEGRVVSMGALKNSLLKIRQLEFFELDKDNPIDFDNIDPEKKTVDIHVRGEEAERTEMLFGGGWSELDGFFGQFSFRTRNFRGRGETLAVAVQSGRVRDLYEVSYYVPWIFDRPQSAGGSLFDRTTDFFLDDIDSTQRLFRKERGGSLTYARSLGLFQSLRLTYGFTTLEDTTELTFPDQPTFTQRFEFDKSSLIPGWTYNSLDSRLEPTIGLRLQAQVEYAGGFLGGNVDLYRPIVDVTLFRPVSRRGLRTSVGLHAEGGLVEPYGGADLPILERFYLGGENSVRGFATRSIFLRDEDGNPVRDPVTRFILGGDSFVELSVEYHLILGGPFRVVLFTDAGNVFGEGQDFDFDGLRKSAGAELRVNVPVFGVPLRFIYAVNLDPLPNGQDDFENFQFSLGTSF